MVRFAFTIAQAAIKLALILINELKHASPLLAGVSNTQSMIPTAYLGDGPLDPQTRDMGGVKEYYNELRYSYESLLEGYRKYGHVMESLHESCKPFVRLNKKNIAKYGKDSSIEVITVAKGKQIIIEAKSKKTLGKFIYPFRKRCTWEKGESDDLSKMGYKFFKVVGGQIVFLDSYGLEMRAYYFGAPFEGLKRIMEHYDPFEQLAYIVGKKTLKIEFAIEDEIRGQFSLLYSHYSQTATVEGFPFTYKIHGKAMGYYHFSINEGRPKRYWSMIKLSGVKGLLAQPLISKKYRVLRWNSQTERYDLVKLNKKPQ